jgi:pimeloyl-ACP methyl ester carboxylesterase
MTSISSLPFAFPQGLSGPQPFEIKVNADFIQQTQAKVNASVLPEDYTDIVTNEGIPVVQVSEVVDYWKTDYDWSTIEAQMNGDFHHFVTSINGTDSYPAEVPLHFVHERSQYADAIPLLLLHGWPSTHLEWSNVIGPLTQNATVPFHVVAPDLPGFGFSPAPERTGFSPIEAGEIMDALMKQLGYAEYGIASTDLGWEAAMWQSRNNAANVIGHFTDFFLLGPSSLDMERYQQNQTDPEETAFIESFTSWATLHTSYSAVQSQKPLAVSYAFGDSPVGYMAWIWDLVNTISDGYVYEPSELITNTLMLLFPGAYSNIRWYLEFFKVSIVPTSHRSAAHAY